MVHDTRDVWAEAVEALLAAPEGTVGFDLSEVHGILLMPLSGVF